MSGLRAWFYLVWLSWQRQARARQTVWMALGLLAFAAVFVGLNTARDRWDMNNWRQPRRGGPTYRQWLKVTEAALPPSGLTGPMHTGFVAAYAAALEHGRLEFVVFSRAVVFSVFVSFLLPLWSLSFATEAVGGEREAGNLVWLLSRPLPRPAVYLGKFVAVLPWSLGLNLGGFGLLCLLGGRPGPTAFALYWPAVFWATLAFAALFHLFGVCFRRPALVAVVYAFFLETLLGTMPGYMKRVSVSFYVRCLMFDAARGHGVEAERPSVFLPVEGATAWWVLVGLTVALLALGTVVFSRAQYNDQG